MYKAMEHVILDQIHTAVLGKDIGQHMDGYLERATGVEALRNIINHKKDLLAQPASFVQTKMTVALSVQHKVRTLRTTSMANSANMDAPRAAEAGLLQKITGS